MVRLSQLILIWATRSGIRNATTVTRINLMSQPDLGPLFTGFGQDIRSLQVVQDNLPPNPLQLPATAPGDLSLLIQRSLDSGLHAPTEHVWNLTFERQLPKGAVLTLSYVGRMARSLLARRDVAAFNDLRDPQTGVDWYTAGTALEKLRQAGVPIADVPSKLPAKVSQYFQNMFPSGSFPNLAALLNDFENPFLSFDPNWTNAQAVIAYQDTYGGYFTANDWTDTQAELDFAMDFNSLPLLFTQPQYGALSTWATIGNSNYHALTASLRERLSSLTFDLNYTWSHSLDDASGLQQETGFGNQQSNGAFIVNPLRQRENYANSDFDVRHNINANAVWQLPFGKGQPLMNGAAKLARRDSWGLAAFRNFPLEHRAAYSRTLRRRPVGNELGRAVERVTNTSHPSRARASPRTLPRPSCSAIAM